MVLYLKFLCPCVHCYFIEIHFSIFPLYSLICLSSLLVLEVFFLFLLFSFYRFFGIFYQTTMSSVNRGNLIFFLSNLYAFYPFSCLIGMARASSTMFSKSGDSRCLILLLISEGFSLSQLSILYIVYL